LLGGVQPVAQDEVNGCCEPPAAYFVRGSSNALDGSEAGGMVLAPEARDAGESAMKRAWMPAAVFLVMATFAVAQQPKLGTFGTTNVNNLTFTPVDTSKATQPPSPLQSSYPMPSTFFPRTSSFRSYFPTKLSLGSNSLRMPSFFRSSQPVTNIPLPAPPLPKTVPPPDTKKKT